MCIANPDDCKGGSVVTMWPFVKFTLATCYYYNTQDTFHTRIHTYRGPQTTPAHVPQYLEVDFDGMSSWVIGHCERLVSERVEL